jgi:hypothetical protein
MKTIFSFLFLCISVYGFSQSTFSEKTFKDMMLRYQTKSSDFIKNETSPDFIFVGANGSTMDKNQFLGFIGTSSAFLTNEFSNIKIRQYGKTAIVTGLWSHSHQSNKDNSVSSYEEFITNVFVLQKGKWIFVSHHGATAQMKN